jgi:hypothetical protein
MRADITVGAKSAFDPNRVFVRAQASHAAARRTT